MTEPLKKPLCALLAAPLPAASLTACGGGAKAVGTRTGSFAIAFAENYAKADAALADFKALPKE